MLKICIIGPGIVGQATGKSFIAKGLDVSFIGIDPVSIDKLKTDGYKAFLASEFFNGNFDFDVIFLTVPTPTKDNTIDLSHIDKASIDIGKHLAYSKKYQLIVVKSTVLPGTSENLVIKNITKYSGKQVGQDFGVCMNPEYLREKTALEDALEPWLIVIGEYDQKSGETLSKIYEGFDSPIFRVSLIEAEIQKYIHNLYNAAKITFFNEMREIGQKLGIDTDKVFELTTLSAEGIWNPAYGIYDKGPFSGSCLPKDTKAFANWAVSNGFKVDLLESVINVNNNLTKNIPEQNQDQLQQGEQSLPL